LSYKTREELEAEVVVDFSEELVVVLVQIEKMVVGNFVVEEHYKVLVVVGLFYDNLLCSKVDTLVLQMMERNHFQVEQESWRVEAN
jgi:hypothetical protein